MCFRRVKDDTVIGKRSLYKKLKLIKITSGGHHAWYKTRYGIVRKPIV